MSASIKVIYLYILHVFSSATSFFVEFWWMFFTPANNLLLCIIFGLRSQSKLLQIKATQGLDFKNSVRATYNLHENVRMLESTFITRFKHMENKTQKNIYFMNHQ